MKILLKNPTIIDGTKEMNIISGKDILIVNDLIKKIDTNIVSDKKTKVIDLTGKFVMPGMINLHVHLAGSGKPGQMKSDTKKLVKIILSNKLFKEIGIALCKSGAMSQLKSGVTTVRSVGGVGDIDTILKRRMIKKNIGPRFLACNFAIGPEKGHMVGTVTREVKSIQEAIELVRVLKSQNVDLVKIMITGGVLDAACRGEPGVLRMQPEYVKAICDEAHKLNLKVAAHVESDAGVHVAIVGGVDSIEHGGRISEDDINIMKKRNAAVVMTLSPALPLSLLDEEVSGYNDDVAYNSKVVVDGMIEGFKCCIENNINVGLGTDTGCPFVPQYGTWREVALLNKYVVNDPKLALHLITLGNAKIAGIDDITGSVEENKCADLIVLDKNPLEEIRILRQPNYVFFRGKFIKNPKIKRFESVENALDRIC